MWPPWAVTSSATWGDCWAACSGSAGGGGGEEVRSPGLCREPRLSTSPHGSLSLAPKASRVSMLTMGGGEGVVGCIEAEHRCLDGSYFSSWACCVVVGNTVFVSKDYSCVALIKLADRAGLWVVESGVG